MSKALERAELFRRKATADDAVLDVVLEHSSASSLVRCRRCSHTDLHEDDTELDDHLLDAALEATGESEKTKVIHLGLQALVRLKAAERLADLGGTAPASSNVSTCNATVRKRSRIRLNRCEKSYLSTNCSKS